MIGRVYRVACWACDGHGVTDAERCDECGGRGSLPAIKCDECGSVWDFDTSADEFIFGHDCEVTA